MLLLGRARVDVGEQCLGRRPLEALGHVGDVGGAAGGARRGGSRGARRGAGGAADGGLGPVDAGAERVELDVLGALGEAAGAARDVLLEQRREQRDGVVPGGSHAAKIAELAGVWLESHTALRWDLRSWAPPHECGEQPEAFRCSQRSCWWPAMARPRRHFGPCCTCDICFG